jgi:alpha-L-rhamnosidase
MLTIHDIRVEYLKDPLGVDILKPRFFWKLESDIHPNMQSAYQVVVHEANLSKSGYRLVWDSGKVQSEQSTHVEYDGEPLRSHTAYLCQLKVWDTAGNESSLGKTHFETVFLDPANEWKAYWISKEHRDADVTEGTCDYLRSVFQTDGRIVKARLYATALGMYEVWLNGERVGDWHLTPGWTSYHTRLQYQTYDVTQQLQEGQNAIGGIVGDGWYKGNLTWGELRNLYGDRRGISLELRIWYEDGREQSVITDSNWVAGEGPIRYSEIYHGERYDARLTNRDWADPTYIPSAVWRPVELLENLNHRLLSQRNEPVRKIQEIKPIATLRTPEGDHVLDFGQNMIGWVRFTVRQLVAGSVITLHHAEVLDREGNFYTANLRNAKQEITYICRGELLEQYEPHFTFQGFRYVRVTGYPGDLNINDFTGIVLHSDMDMNGTFECSEPLLNQLYRNIIWGQKGNFVDIPTDCPQRDERLGWTGDAQVFARTAAYNMNVAAFFTKWLLDLKADQLEDGGIPFVIPTVLSKEPNSSTAWGDAAVICPWVIYQMYGDERVLAQQYPSMKGWVEYIRSQATAEGIWNSGFHFGDWLGLDAKEGSMSGATPKELIATAYYAYSTELLARSAQILGFAEDEVTYRNLHTRIVEAFNKEFVTATGRIAAPFQTAHVLALYFQLLPEQKQQRAIEDLAKLIENNDGCMTTGFVGTPYICLALSRYGRNDLAYQLALNRKFPSWLYSVEQGATTIWEHWDGIKPDGTFWSEQMNSFNHYAYGSIGEWLFRVVAGIDVDQTQPGFKHIRIQPMPDPSLGYVKATYNSLYGEIRSSWNYEESDRFRMQLTLPANTRATIKLPGAHVSQVEPKWNAVAADGGVEISVGSGNYEWEYVLAK